ncbi:S-layer homology domain-containing protein [Paenibacillus sp. YIM B09110]|uniref:S-layer homology domain-containing protein n=1 Tax=Paenibacillus sp. YIM B09110 TaxID=3126102 RepID=UPI00301C9C07
MSWTSKTSNTTEFLNGVAYGNSTFVAVGQRAGGVGNGTIVTSGDGGDTWVAGSIGEPTNVYDVVYGHNKFVAVGAGGKIWESTDNGVSWTTIVVGPTFDSLMNITYGKIGADETYVAVGYNGVILTSTNDGVTWSSQTIASLIPLRGVTNNGTTFVAVGDNGTILTSTDQGSTWTDRTSGAMSENLRGVTFGGSEFVAVGDNGTILTSPDGTTWTSRDSGSPGIILSGVVYGSSDYVVAGDGAVLLQNYDPRSVTYDDNGSSGGTTPTDSTPYVPYTTVMVLGNGTLVKTNYTFVGWNTAADGSGTSYSPSGMLTITTDMTLFAQWRHEVIYDGNGNSGGTPPLDVTPYQDNDLVTVQGNVGGLVKTGFRFTGWNTAANGSGTSYSLSDTFTITSNVTLYAQYVPVPVPPVVTPPAPTYTLTYNGNGNTGGIVPTDNKSYVQNESITLLGNTGSLEKTDYAFAGWNTAADGSGKEYTANAAFTMGSANVTLYAQWIIVPYTDISGHWAESNIIAMSRSIVRGYPDNTFRPDNTVTRAEFAVMLIKALKPEGIGAALTFTDAAQIGSWAEKEVSLAVKLGIIKGYTDGSFRPDKEISRAEMAAIIARALKLTLDETAITGFTDDKDLPKWAKSSIVAVNKAGIMQGRGSNKFAPAHATRAEAVTVLMNMLAR